MLEFEDAVRRSRWRRIAAWFGDRDYDGLADICTLLIEVIAGWLET